MFKTGDKVICISKKSKLLNAQYGAITIGKEYTILINHERCHIRNDDQVTWGYVQDCFMLANKEWD